MFRRYHQISVNAQFVLLINLCKKVNYISQKSKNINNDDDVKMIGNNDTVLRGMNALLYLAMVCQVESRTILY